MADPLEALAEECEEVSKIVLDLPEADFARPTRCTAWNVKEGAVSLMSSAPT